jgi:hypothetical protein
MAIATKTIAGYLCTIEPNEDREGVNCYVSKGKFSASLACLEGEGKLFDMDNEMPVRDETIDLIRKFADQHGY